MSENAFKAIRRQKIAAAMEAVAEGTETATAAAEKYGIPLDDLREGIRDRKKKVIKGQAGIPKVKAELSKRYQASSKKNNTLFKNLFEGYMDGEVSPQTIDFALKQLQKLIDKQSGRMAELRTRWANAKKVGVLAIKGELAAD